MDTRTISDAARRFFEIELRNGAIDDLGPQTIGTAIDSLAQAPDDILDEWGVDRRTAIEIANLAVCYQDDCPLEVLL